MTRMNRMAGAAWVARIGFVVLLLSCVGAAAQQSAKTARIGLLSLSAGSNPNMDVFLFRGLRELGWIEGKNLSVEYRWAAGQQDRLPELAADLVRRNVDLIVTSSTPAALAAKQATTRIPIVITFVADPVGSGLVAGLARPGGNVTGITTLTPELVAKRLELVKQLASRASRIAVLWDPAALPEGTMRYMREQAEAAGRSLGVATSFIEVRRAADLDQVFASMSEARIGALVVSPFPTLFEARSEIVAQAAKSGLPTIYPWREAVDAGGLASYATNFPEMYRRAAIYVDKILKGARPAELPIEQPTQFEFVINLKAAKTLGLSVPDSLLQRADEVLR
ncbi:MAG TPA: ABC transporter substrate-binding protein [Burkholderiales bacterium]|nr:ABC transporter substrate-binding protein [Burkholderiales bacterium]